MQAERPRIFISHSWQDKDVARRLEDNLRTAGIEVWVDHRGIRAGDNLPDEISNALHWCNILLLIWSKASVDSYWVKLEWSNALALKKNIIPFLLDETPLPSILSHKAYIKVAIIQQGLAALLLALPDTNPQSDTSKQNQGGALSPNTRQELSTSSEKKRNKAAAYLGHNRTRTAFVLWVVGAILVALVSALTWKGWSVYQSTQIGEPLGSHAKASPPTTVMLMVVDVSSSLSPSQIQQVAGNANSILGSTSASTKFAIYPLQPNWNLPIAMETGETGENPSTVEQRILEEKKRRETILKTAEDFRHRPEGRVSCIVDALPFAQRYFSQYDPSRYEYELVFLSDMMDNCTSSLLGRRVDLERDLSEINAGINLRDRIDLSNVKVTVIVPTSSDFSSGATRREPRFEDLERFWKRLFASCGFSDQLLNDKQHFVFTTFLPERFKVKS